MFENTRRGWQARDFTTNVPKSLDLVIEKLSIAFMANVRFKLINFQMRNRQIKTA